MLQVRIQQHLQLSTSVATQFGREFYPAPEPRRSPSPASPCNRASPTQSPCRRRGPAAYGGGHSAPRIPPENSPASPETAHPPQWNAPAETPLHRQHWRSSP